MWQSGLRVRLEPVMVSSSLFGPCVIIKPYKVLMMRSCALSALRVCVIVLGFSVRSFTEQQFLCSSNTLSLWWEYEGPLHHVSVSAGSCANGMEIINANYTLITKFTITRVGYNMAIYYKKQLWMETFQPPVPCKEFKICNVIKGETISETLSLPIKPYYAAEGEYSVHIHLNIIDDLEKEIMVRVKVNMQVRKGQGERELLHRVKAP